MTWLIGAAVAALGYVGGRRVHRWVQRKYLDNSLMR